MEIKDAIKWLNEELNIWEQDCKSNHPAKQALQMAISALEKQIAKKPESSYDGYADGNPVCDYYCPSCNNELDEEAICPKCGQRIDWEVDE